MSKPTKRSVFATLSLVLLICLLLGTVRGAILTDGVAFYAPIMVCGFLVWRFVVFPKHRARSFTFLAGAAGGLVGTLLWPTWILVWQMFTGTTDPGIMPLAMFFAICFIASILGGVVAMILSVGFDRQPQQAEPEPAANQSEPTTDQIVVPNTV